MMFRFAARTLILITCAAIANAQDPDTRSSPVFLERSYIFHRLPSDALLFEGHIAPHLFFRQGPYQDAGELYESPDYATRSWALSFTPLVRLRMFSTRSNPVRTPSFMPKFTLQFFWVSLIDPSLRLDSPVRIVALNTIPWGHHSNGQEGCLYADQTMNANGECLDGVIAPGMQRATNKLDGSFSTNYFRIWAAYRHLQLDGNLVANDLCTFSLGYEGNPRSFGPGSISDEQRALYPTQRFYSAVDASWRTFLRNWAAGRTAASVQTEYLHRVAPHLSPWTFAAELSHSIARLGGWGVFARYYRGMDYYNLGFLDATSYLHLGLVFDATRSDEFSLPADQAPEIGQPRRPTIWRAFMGALDGVCKAITE